MSGCWDIALPFLLAPSCGLIKELVLRGRWTYKKRFDSAYPWWCCYLTPILLFLAYVILRGFHKMFSMKHATLCLGWHFLTVSFGTQASYGPTTNMLELA